MCTGGAFRTKVGVPRGGAVNVISPSLIISIITNPLLLPDLRREETVRAGYKVILSQEICRKYETQIFVPFAYTSTKNPDSQNWMDSSKNGKASSR